MELAIILSAIFLILGLVGLAIGIRELCKPEELTDDEKADRAEQR